MLSLTDNITRILTFVFLVIVMGLVGSLINGQDFGNSRVNFAMFTAAWGIVTHFFLGGLAWVVGFFAWPVVMLTFDFLNFVFTLSAASAMAAGMRVHSCSNQYYLDTNNITQGSSDRCRKGQAATAFLFFALATFIYVLGYRIYQVLGSGLFSSGSRTSRKAGVPTITTV